MKDVNGLSNSVGKCKYHIVSATKVYQTDAIRRYKGGYRKIL